MPKPPTAPILDAIEHAAALDAAAKPYAKKIRGIGTPELKQLLSGSWIGHALHPLLTDVVIGSLMSATVLDVLGGDDDGTAAEKLIAVVRRSRGRRVVVGR
jgi:hypothetical protein